MKLFIQVLLCAVTFAVCLNVPLGCAPTPPPNSPSESTASVEAAAEDLPDANPLRNAYFGDLHVHSKYSYDAFVFGTTASPDDAYRYAKGEPLMHPAGFEMKLSQPLDFYAVADHAALMGNFNALADPSSEISKHPVAKGFQNLTSVAARRAAFAEALPYARGTKTGLLDLNETRSAWAEIVKSANQHNDPGRFTAFIAYEYTSSPESQNMHRNVIFRGSEAPDRPFSRLDSYDPEALWDWMDDLRDKGIETLAIPHNSNGSNGLMFGRFGYEGRVMDAEYADQRMRNETIVEITQVKGTSDTHPALSANDEWADFEIYPYRIGEKRPSQPGGGYVREAYGDGLEMEAEFGFNPYRFGLIGSSDTHNAATSVEEDNFFMKTALLDSNPVLRGAVPAEDGGYLPSADSNIVRGAAGLAGVWAEENTRDSIFDAFLRKETFATTGPRIRLRFFGGYGFDQALLDDKDMIGKAYDTGVPMGGDLLAEDGKTPSFLVSVLRDPDSAPLQRAQIIKVWIEKGQSKEQVFDVACSDGLVVDPDSYRCPDNGATVDLTNCGFSSDKGDSELRTVWTDPEFDPAQLALYYVRILENPTCRWSTWDAIRSGVAPRPGIPATIQERAWSSPIWYIPEN